MTVGLKPRAGRKPRELGSSKRLSAPDSLCSLSPLYADAVPHDANTPENMRAAVIITSQSQRGLLTTLVLSRSLRAARAHPCEPPESPTAVREKAASHPWRIAGVLFRTCRRRDQPSAPHGQPTPHPRSPRSELERPRPPRPRQQSPAPRRLLIMVRACRDQSAHARDHVSAIPVASSRPPLPHSPARQTHRPEPLSPHITTRAERYWRVSPAG
ncbi:MAG: hypothetical protein ACI9R3_006056 [Verrucomicrobiales bacterium]|jgi:hypothetical protein